MYCPGQFTYVVRPGDTLYNLARLFDTTVARITAMNPEVNPYNLRIGSPLVICPGAGYEPSPESPAPQHCEQQTSLTNEMQLVWLQHVYWTRLLIISMADRLEDEAVTAMRLLQNPGDIAAVYARYYSPEAARAIERLITEHIEVGGRLFTAMRDGDQTRERTLRRRWYMNADQMATAFSSINPYYNQEEIREMLFRHLDLTLDEATARIMRDYAADQSFFNEAESEITAMANALAAGIMKQFPQRFA